MLRPEFLSAFDNPSAEFSFAISARPDAASFEYDTWPKSHQIREGATRLNRGSHFSVKDHSNVADMKRSECSHMNANHPIASCYEALMSLFVAVAAHRDTERLFSALAAELPRVVNFDFIGLSTYDHETAMVYWRLCGPNGVIESDVIDGAKEETLSDWVYEHREPLIIPFLNRETKATLRLALETELDPHRGVVAGVYLPTRPSIYTAVQKSGRHFRGEQEVIESFAFVLQRSNL